MYKKEYINYLRKQLIPDLIESGSCATALDFEVACRFLEGEQQVNTGHLDNDEDIIVFCDAWKRYQ